MPKRRRRLMPCLGVGLLAILVPACAGEAFVRAAEGPDEAGRIEQDLDTLRGRVLGPLLDGVDAERALRLAESLGPEGRWPQVDYRHRGPAGWKTYRHLANLWEMARAYRSPHSELRGNEQLRKAVFAGLDCWLEHDFQNPNWWWNQIGVPRSLSRTLLVLDEELSDAQRAKAVEILSRARLGMTGQNLVWVADICIMRGLLEGDAELVAAALRRIADEIRVIPDHEGVQADGSFHQHGPCLYSHGYGAGFAQDCSRLAVQVADTRFAFPPEKIELLSRVILDGHQWMTRGSTVDYGAIGRQIARKGQSARYLKTVAEHMLRLRTGREEELRAMGRRAGGDLSVPLEGNRHFWCSDTMFHQRAGYTASARSYSRRIVNTDMPCNNEGLKSHHIADGCNFIFRTGREYEGIFPVWDWQKLPGTTVEQTPTLSGPLRRRGSRSFVGGASDGRYGLAAFDFARDELAARKAWFFFDREFVCLGAGIRCAGHDPVVTTVNQCRLRGEVSVGAGQEGGDGGQTLARGEHAWRRPAWVHHDGIAYVFLEPMHVRLRNDTQQGSWLSINHMYPHERLAIDVFKLWIDHGRRPTDASYAYAVVPGMPVSAAPGYAAAPDVRVICNDPGVQAVWHRKLRIAGMAFYEPRSVKITEGLRADVDVPCLVLLQESPGQVRIAVSNPENEALTVRMGLSRALRGEDVEAMADGAGCRVTFRLPGGPEAGKSVTRRLHAVR